MIKETKDISTPHDRFWRKMMRYPKIAREFFELHLPADIKNEVQLNSMRLQPGSFIENNLRTQTTDLLYSVKFEQRAGYIYTLIEHQSTPDKSMPFRLLKYIVAIMDRHLKQNKGDSLPVVYPIVVYTGKLPYNCSTDLYDLFGDHKDLAKDIFLQPHQLVDYTQIKDRQLEKFLYHGIVVKTMRHIYDANFLVSLQNVIIPNLKNIADLGEKDYIYTVLNYVFYAGAIDIGNKGKVIEIIQKGLTQEFGDHAMSLAESLEQRGIQIGEQRGKLKGMQIGEQRGKREAATAIAKNLLHQGMSLEQVVLVTGLSTSQVKALQN